MDLPVIEMDPQEARRAFLSYRDEVRARLRDERRSIIDRISQEDREARERLAIADKALMDGYRLVASGKPVLSLSQTIVAGGLTDDGYPRLGIARADQDAAWCEFDGNGVALFSPGYAAYTVHAASKLFRVGGLPEWTGATRWRREATVPPVPAHLRPNGDLSGYATLFEASWHEPRRATRRVGDPALLRPLGGDLYAVVAVWDLTPLERAVLGIAPTES